MPAHAPFIRRRRRHGVMNRSFERFGHISPSRFYF